MPPIRQNYIYIYIYIFFLLVEGPGMDPIFMRCSWSMGRGRFSVREIWLMGRGGGIRLVRYLFPYIRSRLGMCYWLVTLLRVQMLILKNLKIFLPDLFATLIQLPEVQLPELWFRNSEATLQSLSSLLGDNSATNSDVNFF